MYYTVNAENGTIMESSDTCPDPQVEADYFEVEVYIIKGEHTGLSASPSAEVESEGEQCKPG